jgi:hypothetical protein
MEKLQKQIIWQGCWLAGSQEAAERSVKFSGGAWPGSATCQT